MRKRVAAAAVAALVLAGGGAADAQEYPPTTGTLVVSQASVRPGEPVTVAGGGCAPEATVTVNLNGRELGTTTADAEGQFSTEVTIPADTEPGTYTLQAACPPHVLSAQITVEAAAPLAAPAALPVTGSDGSIGLTQVGLALVLVGAGVVFSVRRRRTLGERHTVGV